MVRFLSPGWVAALDRAASDAPPLSTATTGLDLVIEHDVGGSRFHIVIERGRMRVAAGPAESPTITFATDHGTAAAIARGELSALRAFMNGSLRISGDVDALVRAQPAFAELPDVFAAVRDETRF